MVDQQSEPRSAARRIQAVVLAGGAVCCVVSFYAYMLPGMSGDRLVGAVLVSPLALAMIAPFTLHWLLVRHRTVGAVSAVVMTGVAVRYCVALLTDSTDRSALLFALIAIVAVVVLAVSVAASLVVQAAGAAGRAARRP